jgi:hypothetical protein
MIKLIDLNHFCDVLMIFRRNRSNIVKGFSWDGFFFFLKKYTEKYVKNAPKPQFHMSILGPKESSDGSEKKYVGCIFFLKFRHAFFLGRSKQYLLSNCPSSEVKNISKMQKMIFYIILLLFPMLNGGGGRFCHLTKEMIVKNFF